MAGGKTASFFSGHQTVATVDDLTAFVRRAEAGESFAYCEAPDLIRSETSARVNALEAEGLVRPHRRRREGGGWTFYVVRTRKGLAAADPADPMLQALADPATDLIFRALKRAANFARPSPTDTGLAEDAGLGTRDQAQWRVRKLIDAGLISSIVAYEGGVPSRVITIEPTRHAGSASGKSTALPKKWAAQAARSAAEQRAAGAKGNFQ